MDPAAIERRRASSSDFRTGEDPREDKAVADLTFEFFEARRERALAGPRPAAPGAEAFRERLRNEARVLTNGNVDVSAFVGSVVDVALLDEAAAELRRRLGPDVTDAATKILTTGVSGQQLALPLARLMSVPLVACAAGRASRARWPPCAPRVSSAGASRWRAPYNLHGQGSARIASTWGAVISTIQALRPGPAIIFAPRRPERGRRRAGRR